MPASSTINIMHIINSLKRGGMEGGVVNLLNNINNTRFKCSICCLESSGKLSDKLENKSDVFVLNKKSGKSFNLPIQLNRLWKEKGIHIVHTHNYATLLYSRLAKGLRNSPVIIHGEHGDLPLQLGGKKYYVSKKLLS